MCLITVVLLTIKIFLFLVEGSALETFSNEQSITSSGTRMPQSPRRTVHQPAQRFPGRRQLAQLAPGIPGSSVQHFEDDDRMVPSTPTLVAPHRSDGFDQAVQSPQVAGVPRFRFGATEEMPQASTSTHSDPGELASQGGLGMYESTLFLPEEESGGRSVPTTPLQVSAPVFSEIAPSDTTEHASQSVPMVSTSTPGLVSGTAATGEERDDFLEPDTERPSAEASVDPGVSQGDAEEPSQPSDKASLPSTSQEPSSSSADTSSALPKPSRPGPSRQLQRWPEGRGGRMKRGQAFSTRGLQRR